MRRSKPLAAVATATAMFALAACGGSGGNEDGSDTVDREFTETGAGTKDPEAAGPAPEIEGAAEGGTITVFLALDPGRRAGAP